MSTNYVPIGSARLVKRVMVDGSEVRLFSRDVTDGRGGTWHDGCWWVEAPNVNRRKKGSKGRPFIGEMAWCDAERLANDLATELLYR